MRFEVEVVVGEGGRELVGVRVDDANVDDAYLPASGSPAIRLIPAGTIPELDGTLDFNGAPRVGALTAGAIQVSGSRNDPVLNALRRGFGRG